MSSEISINIRKITKCFVFPKNPYRIATSTLLALSSFFNLLDPEHCFLKLLLLLLLLVCSYVLDVCLLQKNYWVLTMSGPGLQGIEALTSAMQTNIIPDQEYLLQVTVRETRYRLTDEKCCRAGSGSKYIEFGTGSRILSQFGSGSRVILSIFKEKFKIILEKNNLL